MEEEFILIILKLYFKRIYSFILMETKPKKTEVEYIPIHLYFIKVNNNYFYKI
jgi:hypothetical protein